jgi:hypothetical protein
MQRFRRRLWDLLAIILILFSAFVIASWVKSYESKGYVDLASGKQLRVPNAEKALWIFSAEGSLHCFLRAPYVFSEIERRGLVLFLPLDGPFTFWCQYELADVNVIGGGVQQGLRIPFVAIAVATAMLPLVRLLILVRLLRRVRKGYCSQCGYDLRASIGHCPECGSSNRVCTYRQAGSSV